MSFIRSLLMEGPEELTLPAAPSNASPAGSPMSQTDFVPPAQSPMSGGAMGAMPTMPTGGSGPATIQKEVMNKELVLAITGELKSVLNAFEKKFESEDMTVDVGSVYLKSFLDTLAFNADKIAALMGVEPAGEAEDIAPEPAPEAALPPPVEPAPEAAPKEDTTDETPLPGENPYSDFTAPEGEAPEGSSFTSPTEAI
ncbi:MAG: hypothetical protein JHC33_10860 [Ignisphaera sp.]|nr:hypothetical protein [Ignisphaera sp.]